jgi:hypothetical protein
VLAHPLAQRRRLGGAKEEALKDELEDPPVLLRLRQRGSERLAEPVGLGPRDLGEHGEGIEQLRGPAVDPLGAQLLAELDEPRGEARRARRRAGKWARVGDLAIIGSARDPDLARGV